MTAEIPPYVILGCGYVGTRLAQSLLADGARVRVCARRVALLEPLRELGAEVMYFDGGRPHQFGPALLGLDRPVVVYSIPGVPDLPQGEAVRRAATAALRMHARAFIYLGSSAVYGRSEEHLTNEWVDEDTAVASNDPDATLRLADEAAIQSVAQAGLRVVVLRLAAIYGPAISPAQPARGVRQRLRAKQYKLWDGGRYYFSRIVVDDLVRVIRAAAARAPIGATYVVGDDHPCPQGEYGRWLASHLDLPEPPHADSHQSRSAGNAIRGRRLTNARLKKDLGLTLLYPTYKEGEKYLDDCEKGAPLPSLSLLAEAAAAAAPPAAVAAPAPVSAAPEAAAKASSAAAAKQPAPAPSALPQASEGATAAETPKASAEAVTIASPETATQASPAETPKTSLETAKTSAEAVTTGSLGETPKASAEAGTIASPGETPEARAEAGATAGPGETPKASAEAVTTASGAAGADDRAAAPKVLSWPQAIAGEDLGVSAGLLPVGARLHFLAPGQRAEPGPLYMVLQGQPRAEWGGQTAKLGPQALVPPGATVHNDTAEPVLLLGLAQGRPVAS